MSDSTHHVTFFRDEFARSMSSAELTLEELSNRILRTKAKTKAKLPWLKMARFGDKTTGRSQCLRHDANVVAITGVELDYDEMRITFSEAITCIRDMKIAALVYTSPSHQDNKPKWRILAPTSKPLPPKDRAKYVARINGAMGTPIKKVESFTLSQSYYFGQAADNPSPNHQCVIIRGDFIDQRDDLAKFEAAGYVSDDIRRQANSSNSKANGHSDDNPFTQAADEAGVKDKSDDHVSGFEEILKRIGDGEYDTVGFNNALHRAAASYVALHNGNEFDEEKLKSLLREAIEKAPKDPNRDPATIKRYLSDKYLNDIIKTAKRKFVDQRGMSKEDFYAYLPMHQYIFVPTRELWPASSINTLPPVPKLNVKGQPMMNKKKGVQRTEPAAIWLDKNRNVQQMTWAPGEKMIIEGKLIDNGGWIEREESRCFNMYRAPVIKKGGVATDAQRWVDHVRRIYPDDERHLIYWLAHRVQKPGEKINHAVLLGGDQGIGKDSLLEPVKRAIGSWNFNEVSPTNLLGRFNGFLRSVILRVSEVRDLGDVNRYAFYEHLKTITAAPPDVLRVDEKHLKEHSILNCCGVILTTNHKTDGIYLPANDRRTYVAWSPCVKEDFGEEYWNELWHWYDHENGDAHVAAYLRELDISAFNAKAPPPKTDAFLAIVSAGHAPEQTELSDIIDELGNPEAVTLDMIVDIADQDFADWLVDRKNRRAIPHRLETAGYVMVHNPSAKDHYYVVNKKRCAIYARTDLGKQQQHVAAGALISYLEGERRASDNVHPFQRPPK